MNSILAYRIWGKGTPPRSNALQPPHHIHGCQFLPATDHEREIHTNPKSRKPHQEKFKLLNAEKREKIKLPLSPSPSFPPSNEENSDGGMEAKGQSYETGNSPFLSPGAWVPAFQVALLCFLRLFFVFKIFAVKLRSNPIIPASNFAHQSNVKIWPLIGHWWGFTVTISWFRGGRQFWFGARLLKCTWSGQVFTEKGLNWT